MPATFSVPARRSRSWWPPRPAGSNGAPRRKKMAPTPLGPWILCAESVSASTPSAVDVDRDLPGRLNGVGMKQRAALVRDLRQRRQVVDVPELVIGERQRHQRRVGAQRRAQRLGIDRAVAPRPAAA